MIDVGTIVGHRYRIEELIGSGGMAMVYRAVNLSNRRMVALKVLKDEYLKHENIAAAGFFGYISGAEITNSGTGSALTGTIAYADEDAGERSFGILAGNAADSE